MAQRSKIEAIFYFHLFRARILNISRIHDNTTREAGSVPSAMITTFFNSQYTRLTAITLLALTAFRLWYSTHLELVGDEAYYWLWSRHPDLCYLDKGPAIAWTIWAGTALFGQTVFGIRFFAVLLASATGFGMFLLARWLFSDRVGFWALVLAALCPLFAAGATLMTIDTIYVAFWTFAALAFWR